MTDRVTRTSSEMHHPGRAEGPSTSILIRPKSGQTAGSLSNSPSRITIFRSNPRLAFRISLFKRSCSGVSDSDSGRSLGQLNLVTLPLLVTALPFRELLGFFTKVPGLGFWDGAGVYPTAGVSLKAFGQGPPAYDVEHPLLIPSVHVLDEFHLFQNALSKGIDNCEYLTRHKPMLVDERLLLCVGRHCACSCKRAASNSLRATHSHPRRPFPELLFAA